MRFPRFSVMLMVNALASGGKVELTPASLSDKLPIWEHNLAIPTCKA